MTQRKKPVKGQLTLFTLDLLGWKKVGKFGKGTVFAKGKEEKVVGKHGLVMTLKKA